MRPLGNLTAPVTSCCLLVGSRRWRTRAHPGTCAQFRATPLQHSETQGIPAQIDQAPIPQPKENPNPHEFGREFPTVSAGDRSGGDVFRTKTFCGKDCEL